MNSVVQFWKKVLGAKNVFIAYHFFCFVIVSGFLFLYLQKITLIQLGFESHPWIAGDWLINYSHGFIRRGLSGEFVEVIGAFMGLSPIIFLVQFKNALYVISVLFFLLIAYRKKIGVIEIILVGAPWAWMFELNDPSGSGRKEILLICIFLTYTYFYTFHKKIIRIGKFRIDWSNYFLIICLPILSLMHDGLIFFYPFFYYVTYLHQQKGAIKKDISLKISLIINFGLVLLLLGFYNGTPEQAKGICDYWTNAHLFPEGFCAGAISALKGYSFTITSAYFFIYAPIFLLTFIPLYIYGLLVISSQFQSYFRKGFFVLLCFTIPLYFIGADWGRWIHISSILFFISLLSAKTKTPPKFSVINLLFCLVILMVGYFYVFQWKIPHWIGDGSNITWAKQNRFIYWNNLSSP